MLQQDQLQFNENIKFNFSGGDLTSDEGLFLIQEFSYRVKFPQLLNEFFYLEHDLAN